MPGRNRFSSTIRREMTLDEVKKTCELIQQLQDVSLASGCYPRKFTKEQCDLIDDMQMPISRMLVASKRLMKSLEKK